MIITDIDKLKIKSELVKENEVVDIVSALHLELEEMNKFGLSGIGLAASQIGIYKQAAIIRINNFKINLINCSISEGFDLQPSKEGCLSMPGQTCIVNRCNEIIIRDNILGNINNFVAYGLVAVCIQHEIDHFFGVLMTDKIVKAEFNSVGDNMPCPCNSGLKYKKCCKKTNYK